jgi:F0F1-type ATP synthase assembly protein I
MNKQQKFVDDVKKAAGEPKTGIHSYRVADLAIVDVVGTIGLGWLTDKIFHTGFVASTIGWFVAGESLHLAFGVETTIAKKLKGQ